MDICNLFNLVMGGGGYFFCSVVGRCIYSAIFSLPLDGIKLGFVGCNWIFFVVG